MAYSHFVNYPIWSTSHFVNSHLVNSHLVNVDKVGTDKVGIDKVGIDELGINRYNQPSIYFTKWEFMKWEGLPFLYASNHCYRSVNILVHQSNLLSGARDDKTVSCCQLSQTHKKRLTSGESGLLSSKHWVK